MITGPLGVTDSTLKKAARLPNRAACILAPSTTGSPSSKLPMYCKSRSAGVTLVGVRTIRSAGRHFTLLIFTVSSRPTPAFSRVRPSNWTRDWPRISLKAGMTLQRALRFPSTSTVSPIAAWSRSRSSGPIRARARPTSLVNASVTFSLISGLSVSFIAPHQSLIPPSHSGWSRCRCCRSP